MRGLGIHPDDRAKHASLAYNGSLDAAKALHEAVLPGWVWACGSSSVYVCKEDFSYFHIRSENNPARAWLIAIIKALIDKEECR